MKNTKKKIKKVTAKQLFETVAVILNKKSGRDGSGFLNPFAWKSISPTAAQNWKVIASVVNRLLAQ